MKKLWIGFFTFAALTLAVAFFNDNAREFLIEEWHSVFRSKELNAKITTERKVLANTNVADTHRSQALGFLAEQHDPSASRMTKEWIHSDNKTYRISALQSIASNRLLFDKNELLEIAKKYPSSDEEYLVAQIMGAQLNKDEALQLVRDEKQSLGFRTHVMLGLIEQAPEASAEQEDRSDELLKMVKENEALLEVSISTLSHRIKKSPMLESFVRKLSKNEKLSYSMMAVALQALALVPSSEDGAFWTRAALINDDRVLAAVIDRAERFCAPNVLAVLNQISIVTASATLKHRIKQKVDQIQTENLCRQK